MVAVRYIGILEPEPAFEKLRPLREELIRMAGRYAPTSWEYAELHKPVLALDACAEAITRRPRFYSLLPHTSRGGATEWPKQDDE